jgi:hypothetical protein
MNRLTRPDAPARGLQVFLGGLLLFLFTTESGVLGHWLAAGTTLLAPLATAIIIGNACGPRPWLGRLPWRPQPRHATTCMLIGLLALGLAMVTAVSNPRPTNGDQFTTTLCAALDTLHGHDPYRTGEPQCLREAGIGIDVDVTPVRTAPFNPAVYPTDAQLKAAERTDLADGTSAGFPRLGYPPLSFIAILPFAELGFGAVTGWVLLLVLLTLALVARRDPRHAPWHLASMGLGFAWFIFAFQGDPEILAFCALILAVAYLDRPILSAILVGLALCDNQLTWFALPAYLLIAARQPGLRPRLIALGLTLVVVVAGWSLYDPAYIGEQWAFVTLPLYPLGIGLIDLLPAARLGSGVFDLAFICTLLAGYTLAWRRPEWSWAVLAVCWVAFWMAWRNITPYYLPMLWLAPAVALVQQRLTPVAAGNESRALDEAPPNAPATSATALRRSFR